jgi:hypothetical protein
MTTRDKSRKKRPRLFPNKRGTDVGMAQVAAHDLINASLNMLFNLTSLINCNLIGISTNRNGLA